MRPECLAVLVLGLAACQDAPDRDPYDALVGCYTLELGDWQPMPEVVELATLAILPDFIRLRSDTGPSLFYPEGSRRVSPVLLSVHHSRLQERAYWVPHGTDSLAISWSDGFEWVTISAVIRGDSLIGAARAFTDVHYVEPVTTAPVVGISVACG